MIYKLSRNFRFHSTAVTLIKSNLSNRHQCVCVGVIQGLILGPVLFLLFINDLLEVIMFSQAHLYANDVQISVSGNLSDAAISCYNNQHKIIPFFKLSSNPS
jgi:hypothetical protein